MHQITPDNKFGIPFLDEETLPCFSVAALTKKLGSAGKTIRLQGSIERSPSGESLAIQSIGFISCNKRKKSSSSYALYRTVCNSKPGLTVRIT
jgi:hypothetical protein